MIMVLHSAIFTIIGVIVGAIIALHLADSNLVCHQSVVHNDNAVCAVYLNKDLISVVK